MEFVAGMVVGWLIAESLFIAILFLLTTKRVSTIEYRQKLQNIVRDIENRHKEPVTIIRSTTEAEKAMEHVKNINADRGGIPNHELQ